MRARLLATSALAVLALAADDALAKAPKDTPTVEEMYQQAVTALEEQKKRDAEKARDPNRELIEAYRDRKTPKEDFQPIVAIINDAKTDSVQPYRSGAATALITRFSREDESDPSVKVVRRTIALAVIDLMKATKDDVGLAAVEQILYAWWRMKVFEYKFKATDKLDDRKRAWGKMKKYLEKGEN